jgi:tetratricopeptide (TPR) repeat protein
VWDRYDVRENHRDHDDAWDRNFGSRGGTGERNRNHEGDSREVFTKDLDLPRSRERRSVRERDRVYEINGTESRMLATIGAFRVVSEADLHDLRDESDSPCRSARHLEREGLIRTSPLSSDDRAVTLTDRGRALLEANRYERCDRTHERRQVFHAGVRKPRELTHDTKVYRAYQRADERLRGGGARVWRVVLDYELKRDYQRFLHERNRGKKDCDGRPDREPEEIARWAREHELPYDDGHVRFPDARIEYEDRDGRSRHEDLEIVTGHYRGAHAGSAAKSGFTCYLSIGCSVGGRGGGGRRTALGHAQVGFGYSVMGESALARPSLVKAYQLRDRASDVERFLIDTLYDRDVTGDLERERRTLATWAESYPRDARPHGLISDLALTSTGQYELAIAEADRAIALDPDLTPAYVNKAMNQLFLNRLDDALLTVGRATERKLQSPEWLTAIPYFVAFLKSSDDELRRTTAVSDLKTLRGVTQFPRTATMRRA